MKTNLNLSEKSEEYLKRIKAINAINLLGTSKDDVIEVAIKIAGEIVQHLDTQRFEKITDLKKEI